MACEVRRHGCIYGVANEGDGSGNNKPDVSTGSQADITLSEALETYLAHKGANKGKAFHAAAQRACACLVETCG